MREPPDEPSLLTSENVELLQQDAPWTRQSGISGHAQAQGLAQPLTTADEPVNAVRQDAVLSGTPQTLGERSPGLGPIPPQLVGPFGGPLGGRVPLLAVPASEGEARQGLELPKPSQPSFAAPIPFDEAGRQATVACLAGPEEDEDPVLHSLCELVTRVLDVPLAGVSLVETGCQRFHAMAGMQRFNLPRELSICGWTLQPLEPEVLIIEDLTIDARTKEHPAVVSPQPGMPPVKFYAGAPLVASNGYRLGSLCVLDVKPRTMAAGQLNVLANLAELVVRQLEKDHILKLQKLQNQGLLRSLDTFNQGMLLVDVAQPGWKVLHASETWSSLAGTPAIAVLGKPFWDSFIPVQETRQSAQDKVLRCQQDQSSCLLQVEQDGHVSLRASLLLRFIPAGTQTLLDIPRMPGSVAPAVGIPNSVPDKPSAPSTLFFATIIPPDQADLNSSILSTISTNEDGSSRSTTLSTGKPPLSFEEVALGVLIRATPSGRLFRGHWNKEPVTVKIMERFIHECTPVLGGYAPEEALLSCSLAHPNLVRGYRYATRTLKGVAATHGEPWVEVWLVEEACNMGTLSAAMQQGLFLEPGSRQPRMLCLLNTIADIAGALCCLHADGYIHGHVSGDSVWLSHASNSRGFIAKLRDFSLQPELHTNMLPLTAVAHAAPELVSQGKVSPAGDIYALGTIMWELAHQQRIWHNLSLAAVRERVGRRKQQPAFSSSLPELFTGLAKMCMAADPAERPTAKSLQRALHKFAQQEETRLQRASSGSPTVLDPPRTPNFGQAPAQQKEQAPASPPSGRASKPAESPDGGQSAGSRARLQRWLCCCKGSVAS